MKGLNKLCASKARSIRPGVGGRRGGGGGGNDRVHTLRPYSTVNLFCIQVLQAKTAVFCFCLASSS